jgi:hypothetical protein
MIEGPVGMGSATEEEFQRLFSIARHVDVVGEILLTQSVQRQLDVIGIVFHQQNFDFIHLNSLAR